MLVPYPVPILNQSMGKRPRKLNRSSRWFWCALMFENSQSPGRFQQPQHSVLSVWEAVHLCGVTPSPAQEGESQGPKGHGDGEQSLASRDIPGSYSLQSKCFESSTFSVTSQVTMSWQSLDSWRNHVKGLERILSKGGVMCFLYHSAVSWCVTAQPQVYGVGQTFRRGSRKQDPGRGGKALCPGGLGRS